MTLAANDHYDYLVAVCRLIIASKNRDSAFVCHYRRLQCEGNVRLPFLTNSCNLSHNANICPPRSQAPQLFRDEYFPGSYIFRGSAGSRSMLYSTIQIGQFASTIRKESSHVRYSRSSGLAGRACLWPRNQGRTGGCSQFYLFRALLSAAYRRSRLVTVALGSGCRQSIRCIYRDEFHNKRCCRACACLAHRSAANKYNSLSSGVVGFSTSIMDPKNELVCDSATREG